MATDIIAKSTFIKSRIVVIDLITPMYNSMIVAARHRNKTKLVDRTGSSADVRLSSQFFRIAFFRLFFTFVPSPACNSRGI